MVDPAITIHPFDRLIFQSGEKAVFVKILFDDLAKLRPLVQSQELGQGFVIFGLDLLDKLATKSLLFGLKMEKPPGITTWF